MAVALYARISRDPSEQRTGVDGQLARLREYAARTWPGAEVVEWDDNDLTAADPDVDRPGYAALLDAVRAGDVAALVAVEQSRLTRQPAQWEELCLILTRAGIDEVHTLSGGVVSVAPAMRLVGRVMAAVDAEEVERIRARTRAAHARLRSEGRPGGGRPYGYVPGVGSDGRRALLVDAEQAAVVRRIVAEVLSGRPMAAVAAGLEADGVPTPRGGARWRRQTVSSVLRSEAIAGMRDGVAATWEPIIDAETWREVRALLSQPARWRVDGVELSAGRGRAPSYPYLLSGLAWCGRCGWPLRGSRQSRRRGGTVAAYSCNRVGAEPRRADGGPCCGVSIAAAPLDEVIAEAVLLEASSWRQAPVGDDGDARAPLLAEVAAADAVVADLAAMYGRGEIEASEWRAGREAALRRSRDAHRALAALGVADGRGAPLVGDEWASASLGERRRSVAMLVSAVRVAPGVWVRGAEEPPAEWPLEKSGRPSRVWVEWRA